MKIIKHEGKDWVQLEEYNRLKHNYALVQENFKDAIERSKNYGFSKSKMNKFYEEFLRKLM